MKLITTLILCTTVLLGTATVRAQQPGVPSQPGKTVVQTTPNVSVDVSKTLDYVNSLFNLYNEYNTRVAVDKVNNELVFSDKFSELRGYFGAVEFRRSGELMGLYCKDGTECLRVEDVDTGNTEPSKIKYTFGMKEDGKAVPEMDRAIEKLNNMLAGLAGSSSSYSSGGLSAIARKNLKIINDAFDTYNNYETVFSVQGTKLHWDSSVANVSADLNKLTFYIDYGNNWMVMRCTEGDCIEGSGTKASYSMGLSKDGIIAPNIEQVLLAFNDLRREILTR